MAEENFLREFEFEAGNKGKKHGFKITSKTTSDCPVPMHINFSIEKSDVAANNTGTVKIHNLSSASRRILREKNCIVYLKAGYGKNLAQIMCGTVKHAKSERDGGNLLTTIEIIDGNLEVNETYVSLHYKGKVSSKKIFDALVKEMGASVKYSKKATGRMKKLRNGFSYCGKVKGALVKLCKKLRLKYSIQNSVLVIITSDECISQKAQLINKETGLIGSPKAVSIASTGKKKKENHNGWEVTFLLNGAIGVNDYVKVESKAVTGYFRVKKITIDGDNLEGKWHCVAQLLQIKAPKK